MSTIQKADPSQRNADGLLKEIYNEFDRSAVGIPLPELRQRAIDSAMELGFPTTRHEEWKYTNLKNVLAKTYTQPKGYSLSPAQISEHLLNLEGLEANVLVFVNGVYVQELSKIISSGDQLVVENLADAYRNHPAHIQKHLASYADYHKDVFTALNTAFAQQGTFIFIPDRTEVEHPILLQFIADAEQSDVMVHPRNLVVAGRSSRVSIVENFTSTGAHSSVTNTVTEIVVEPNASVDHYKIQLEEATAHHIGTTQVHQSRDSHFSDTTITLSGGVVRNNLNIVIDGENCEAFLNGLYLTNGATHVDNHTLVDHAKPNSYSNELYKGLLDGKSSGVFNGKIYVRQVAQKTNAFQSNKNILLSEGASVNTKPQLEIWADDVKCSHGCTTGSLDEEPMFYLRARGINEENARALLMFAFAEDVLGRIKIEPIKEYIEQIIEQRLQVEL